MNVPKKKPKKMSLGIGPKFNDKTIIGISMN